MTTSVDTYIAKGMGVITLCTRRRASHELPGESSRAGLHVDRIMDEWYRSPEFRALVEAGEIPGWTLVNHRSLERVSRRHGAS